MHKHAVRRVAATLTIVLSASLGLTALAGPAGAAPVGSPPVTHPDKATVRGGEPSEIKVLANDTDPDGDELAVCRIGDDVPDDLIVVASQVGGGGEETEDEDSSVLLVLPLSSKGGTYTFTYYACDLESLTAGTVTVTVTPAPQLKLKVSKIPGRPGRLKVLNRSDFAVKFLWGSAKEEREDGGVRIKRHHAQVIRVHRTAVIWVALNNRQGAFKVGYVKGIKLPKGENALPPSPPIELDLRTAQRLSDLRHWYTVS